MKPRGSRGMEIIKIKAKVRSREQKNNRINKIKSYEIALPLQSGYNHKIENTANNKCWQSCDKLECSYIAGRIVK
jgi:hypothetical protein